ncbi:CYTH and CHAD domain-containing protein [Streptomyces longwoodensis]|uniref:CYTH and CHAD domain-containing protein n=1 Tax=Streptomyces longwoodensis TaxID=68231 RepID=UPI002DD94035|nr:CYTH and CHAD domain-containing protein [Streptomyces longwoodensis]WRY88594.1 CYTH and CHAD domain-containing protein [Streptomyces longwoodensis]
MAETKREIERKYAADDSGLPDLTGVAGVAAVLDQGVAELDATYYDTPDLRLAAASITLRRRTGGSDAGWHLKLPVSPGVRDEIRAPLSGTLPPALAALVRSRVRDGEPVPVVRLRSARDVRHLVDADGALLAEVSLDTVRAERLSGGSGTAQWTEIEVELADGGDPAFLDRVDKRVRKAGVRPAKSPSKLARALAETDPGPLDAGAGAGSAGKESSGKEGPGGAGSGKGGGGKKGSSGGHVTAGAYVLAYLREQRDAIVALDPAVRQEVPDAVHSMRVATRRTRSAFRSYAKVLDRAVTDPVGAELKWLAGELGVDRDREVLTAHLTAALDDLPATLVAGPVHDRLHSWARERHGGSRRHLIGVLDSRRYLNLLDALDALLADPPLRRAAAAKPAKVAAKAVRKDVRKLSVLVEQALWLPPGQERDVALHEARKRAKRTRYAAEAAEPALGAPARKLVKSVKSVQKVLGEHQDSVMARTTLGELAAVAHAAGESAFTYGVLYGREEHRAALSEAALPERWEKVRRTTAV